MFFRVLISCLDARYRHPFHSFDCHRRPACTAGRPPFRRCRVVARQTSTSHPQSRRNRAPNLRAAERFIAGSCTLFMNPARNQYRIYLQQVRAGSLQLANCDFDLAKKLRQPSTLRLMKPMQNCLINWLRRSSTGRHRNCATISSPSIVTSLSSDPQIRVTDGFAGCGI